ncbi:MAG: dTMP kinase [Gammaproteobacteria bacterium]|jgi:dTMP kinase
MTGKFITFEGIEGAGKSTAIELVQKYLQQQSAETVVTREPGGTKVSEVIRDVVLNRHDLDIVADTELLLFFAARAQHIAQVIKPALAQGKIILCDRFTDASFAYQCGGRGIAEERIAILEQWVQQGLQPDLTILMDLPVAVGLQRAKKRSELDRIEVEQYDFFEKVRAYYLKRAKNYPKRFRVIDASAPLSKIKKELQEIAGNEIL